LGLPRKNPMEKAAEWERCLTANVGQQRCKVWFLKEHHKKGLCERMRQLSLRKGGSESRDQTLGGKPAGNRTDARESPKPNTKTKSTGRGFRVADNARQRQEGKGYRNHPRRARGGKRQPIWGVPGQLVSQSTLGRHPADDNARWRQARGAGANGLIGAQLQSAPRQ